MNTDNKAIKTLVNEIKKCTTLLINNAPFDKTEKGRIIEIIDTGKYKVLINGSEYIIKSSDTYSMGDFVYVKILKNNYSNLIIDTKC